MCVACTASSVHHKERIEILSTAVMTAYMGQLVVEPPEAAERARALDVRAGDAASCRKQCEIACEKSYSTAHHARAATGLPPHQRELSVCGA